MTEITKEIYDLDNPDRGLCAIDGCSNLQRNHGNKHWGKYCDKHHKEPFARAERVIARDKHRVLMKAERSARAYEIDAFTPKLSYTVKHVIPW